MAVLSLASPVDYKARVRARVIAGRLGMHEKHVISSISRLCKAKLLGRAYGYDGGPMLVLLSPSHGSPFPRCLDDVL
jgi:DNA-binding IscR family transcriptional regulator